MNQTERMTPGATMMLTPFTQRVQKYASMSDEQLSRMGKEIYMEHTRLTQAHMHHRLAYEGASKMQGQIVSLSAAQTSDRAKLAATPWYRPFKKAALRSSISARSAQISLARQEFKSSGAAEILASKKGMGLESPAMKQSNQVMREISQSLETRNSERAAAMRQDLQRRKQVHAERQAAVIRQRKAAGPSMAMVMLDEMFDEIEERKEREELEAKIERERPRYGYYPA